MLTGFRVVGYTPSMTTTAVCITTDCPTCEGAGEIGTRQDYWGNWETETCRTCHGVGIISVEEAAAYRAALCPHGVHEDAPTLCWPCRTIRVVEMQAADSWKAATRGGWDAEPPW